MFLAYVLLYSPLVDFDFVDFLRVQLKLPSSRECMYIVHVL